MKLRIPHKKIFFEVFFKMALSLVSHEAELGCIS